MSTTGLGRSQGGVSTTGVGLPLKGWSVYNRCRVTSHTVECPQQMGLSYGGVSTTDVQLPLATGRSVSTTHVPLPLAVGGSVYSGCETTSRRWLSDYFFFLFPKLLARAQQSYQMRWHGEVLAVLLFAIQD